MTLTVAFLKNHEGKWMARCDQFPAWKYSSDAPDKEAAQKSLKRWVGRRLQFSWYGGFE